MQICHVVKVVEASTSAKNSEKSKINFASMLTGKQAQQVQSYDG